jgi:rhodanese-related sulfurtransferase
MPCKLRHARRAAGAALLLALLACGPAGEAAGDVSASELLSRIERGDAPLVLDVRTPAEFAAGHVPGALNIPHDVLGERVAEIAGRSADEVVVYCESGRRAAKAAELLAAAGFTHVRHLAGDMSGWRAAGQPTTRP